MSIRSLPIATIADTEETAALLVARPTEGPNFMQQTKRNHMAHLEELERIVRPYGWSRPFWTVAFAELWCAWILLAWGLQMLFVHNSASMEPVSKAITQLVQGEVPIIVFSGCVIVLGTVQLAALFFWHKGLRLACLLGATSFFMFVTVAFWRAIPLFPGAFICPTYVTAMFIRFVQVCGRRE
jgi:ABC-type dipeptide/oligopeptide/nickel transport system permease component